MIIKDHFLTHSQSLEIDVSIFQWLESIHESFTRWCQETNDITEFWSVVVDDNFPPWYRIEI